MDTFERMEGGEDDGEEGGSETPEQGGARGKGDQPKIETLLKAGQEILVQV